MTEQYKKDSLTLAGAVATGNGLMIEAGIFALTGQVAELAGPLSPLAFLAAAVISGFSAYSYVKLSNAYPSAGGIATFLKKAYSQSTMTGASALLLPERASQAAGRGSRSYGGGELSQGSCVCCTTGSGPRRPAPHSLKSQEVS